MIQSHELLSDEVRSADALEAIETYFDRGWTDGLPVVPPTPERVAEFLDAVGIAASEILGRIPTREVEISAEKVAVNAVMAGCLPEYMPVVVAAVRAMCDESFNLHANSGTLSGAAQIVVVNGPVRRALGIHAGAGVFGPGFRANATIGRAVRLVIRNVGRSVPGFLDRAVFSQPGRFTWCLGEDEEASALVPLHVERGFAPEDSAVTLFAVMDPLKLTWIDPVSPEELLDEAAARVRMVWTYQTSSSFDDRRSLLVVLGGDHTQTVVEAGWTKADLRAHLFGRLTEPDSGREFRTPIRGPDNILIAVAGGRAMLQSWFMLPFPSHGPVSRRIELAEPSDAPEPSRRLR